MPDWADLQNLVSLSGGAMNQQRGIDREVVEHMLHQELGLDTKNLFNPAERNMLIFLAMADAELNIDTSAFRKQFMQDQLSLEGFNRNSLERMINPVSTSYSVTRNEGK